MSNVWAVSLKKKKTIWGHHKRRAL